jgi:Zn-dependent protease
MPVLAQMITQEALLYRLLVLPPLLLSLTVHEFAHARTALAFGDPTARDQGRVSLNPLVHLDLIGTLCIVLTGMFGWAKPVPVNPHNLHPPRLGDIAVSLAGPLSNLMIAVVTGLVLRVWFVYGPGVGARAYSIVYVILLTTATVNVLLCVFNLIPLFPLDGHHVVREVLPWNQRAAFMQWQMRFGSILLMALIFGPRLLLMVTRNPNIPDPLGWIFDSVRWVVLRLVGI